jgi:hypothetical protein
LIDKVLRPESCAGDATKLVAMVVTLQPPLAPRNTIRFLSAFFEGPGSASRMGTLANAPAMSPDARGRVRNLRAGPRAGDHQVAIGLCRIHHDRCRVDGNDDLYRVQLRFPIAIEVDKYHVASPGKHFGQFVEAQRIRTKLLDLELGRELGGESSGQSFQAAQISIFASGQSARDRPEPPVVRTNYRNGQCARAAGQGFRDLNRARHAGIPAPNRC